MLIFNFKLEISIARGVLPLNFYDKKTFSTHIEMYMYYAFENLTINITTDYAVIDIVYGGPGMPSVFFTINHVFVNNFLYFL